MASSTGNHRTSSTGNRPKSSAANTGSANRGGKKKKNNKGIIILGILLVLLVIVIIVAVLMLTKSKPEDDMDIDFDIEIYDEEDEEETIPEDAIELDPDQLNTTLESVDSSVTTDEGWTHYLLLGVDGSGTSYSGVRSDAMIVLSYNPEQGRVVLSSVPRDTLVYIDGKGFTKLTHAYSYGGAALTVQTFKENFDIDISGYITVNFDAMVEIVDLIGGVTLTITEAEANDMGVRYAAWDLHGGTQVLNGKQVLAYCRDRYIDDDFHRNTRQYNALVAIYQKVKGLSVADYTKIITTAYDYVRTDLTAADLISLAGTLLEIMKTADLENVKLVDSSHSSTGYYGQMSVVLMDNLVDTVTRWREALGITDYVPSERTQQISSELSRLGLR